MTRLAVTADDRSGAMEAAALCADAGLGTVVVSWDGEPADAECVVTDLRSRHLSPERAAARAAQSAGATAHPGVRRVHKIDSTLRGNWAAELLALAATTGERVVLVPAYPAAGRRCSGGIVLVHGVPVTETEFARDPGAPVTSSRPSEALAADEARSVDDVVKWLAGPGRAVVVDATTDADVDAAVAAVMGRDDLLVAGPAAVVGAVARWSASPSGAPLALPPGDVLVVCGSRHGTSRAQAEAVRGREAVTVLTTPADLHGDREIVALELAGRAHDHLAAHPTALVILLGGDTADAFLGTRAVRVHGTVGVGTAFGTVDIDGRPVAVVTKPGGFGATNALVDLLERRAVR